MGTETALCHRSMKTNQSSRGNRKETMADRTLNPVILHFIIDVFLVYDLMFVKKNLTTIVF